MPAGVVRREVRGHDVDLDLSGTLAVVAELDVTDECRDGRAEVVLPQVVRVRGRRAVPPEVVEAVGRRVDAHDAVQVQCVLGGGSVGQDSEHLERACVPRGPGVCDRGVQ